MVVLNSKFNRIMYCVEVWPNRINWLIKRNNIYRFYPFYLEQEERSRNEHNLANISKAREKVLSEQKCT